MANSIEIRKFRLIQLIMQLSSEKEVAQLEKEVVKISKKDALWDAIKPIRKSVSIDEMIVEQQYSPIKKEDFYKEVATINIEEPLEELLGKLTR